MALCCDLDLIFDLAVVTFTFGSSLGYIVERIGHRKLIYLVNTLVGVCKIMVGL